jgi:hypothetical protein
VRRPRPAAAAIISIVVRLNPAVAKSFAATPRIRSLVLFFAIAQKMKYVQKYKYYLFFALTLTLSFTDKGI